jgi:hypothetical protein
MPGASPLPVWTCARATPGPAFVFFRPARCRLPAAGCVVRPARCPLPAARFVVAFRPARGPLPAAGFFRVTAIVPVG